MSVHALFLSSEAMVFSPFPDFMTRARRELIPSEDFLVFFVGAISARFRMSRILESVSVTLMRGGERYIYLQDSGKCLG